MQRLRAADCQCASHQKLQGDATATKDAAGPLAGAIGVGKSGEMPGHNSPAKVRQLHIPWDTKQPTEENRLLMQRT